VPNLPIVKKEKGKREKKDDQSPDSTSSSKGEKNAKEQNTPFSHFLDSLQIACLSANTQGGGEDLTPLFFAI